MTGNSNDVEKWEWGFSEIYTHLPERLIAGRDQAAFHFHITGDKVGGGAGTPEGTLALPGSTSPVPTIHCQ